MLRHRVYTHPGVVSLYGSEKGGRNSDHLPAWIRPGGWSLRGLAQGQPFEDYRGASGTKTLPSTGPSDPVTFGKRPLPERPPENQRPVLAGGHGEADGLVDVAQPVGAFVLGGEALGLGLPFCLAPHPVGRQAVGDQRVLARHRFVAAHGPAAAHHVGQVAQVRLDEGRQRLELPQRPPKGVLAERVQFPLQGGPLGVQEGATDIAVEIEKKVDGVRKLVRKMVRDGELAKVGSGSSTRYALPEVVMDDQGGEEGVR